MMMRAFRPRMVGPRPWQLANRLWWFRPSLLILAIVIPVYLSFLTYEYERWVPNRYVPSDLYWWGLVLLLVLALGAAIGGTLGRAPRGGIPGLARAVDVPAGLLATLLALTLLAYAIWFGPIVLQPQRVVELLTGQRDNLRDTLDTLPGITTLTQCGVAYVVLYAVKRYAGTRPVAAWETAGLALVMLLAVVRAILWSERLAVIEVVLAYVVALGAYFSFRTHGTRLFAGMLPFIAPLGLYLAFTATEYFRSWYFCKDEYSSIWLFSYERLATYYAVATNSGIGLLQETRNWPVFTGGYVFQWAYQFPVIGELLTDAIGNTRSFYQQFLEMHGRPEFNNPTGIFVIVFDIGYVGALFYFFVAGLAIGAVHRAWSQQRVGGVLLYPSCFLFVLELLRFNYFASPRFIPVIVSLLIALWVIRSRPRLNVSPVLRQREA